MSEEQQRPHDDLGSDDSADAEGHALKRAIPDADAAPGEAARRAIPDSDNADKPGPDEVRSR